MFDTSAIAEIAVADTEERMEVTTVPDRAEIVIEPTWFAGLDKSRKQTVHWHATASLEVHPACDFQPWRQRTYATVLQSMKDAGSVLFPLALASNGQVIDGRYRLHAAAELGIAVLPAIQIHMADTQVARWIFESKDAREHLSEYERAVLAVQYQRKLRDELLLKRTEAMNQARLGHNAPKSSMSVPKKDSRKEACAKLHVPERKFRTVKRLADRRPDLYEKVLAGEMDVPSAIKKSGKNVEIARVAEAMTKVSTVEIPADGGMENQIHVGDALETMKKLADGIASLTLYSPPYHKVPIEYDPPLPDQTYEAYLDYHRRLLTEAFRISRRGGRLAIVLDTVRDTESARHYMLPVVADMTRLAIDCGWNFWNDLAWFKHEISGTKSNFGSLARCSAPGFARNHETILLFFRGTNKLEGQLSDCDLSRKEHLQWWTTAWDIKPEVNKRIRAVHPAPFPKEIPHRLIKLLTFRGDIVVDPFNGGGTTTSVAKELGRRFVGIDQSAKYCEFARSRTVELTSRLAAAKDELNRFAGKIQSTNATLDVDADEKSEVRA